MVVSPTVSLPAAMSFNSRRMILPLRVLGIDCDSARCAEQTASRREKQDSARVNSVSIGHWGDMERIADLGESLGQCLNAKIFALREHVT